MLAKHQRKPRRKLALLLLLVRVRVRVRVEVMVVGARMMVLATVPVLSLLTLLMPRRKVGVHTTNGAVLSRF